MTGKLKEMNAGPLEASYYIGEKFKGLICARFTSAEVASVAIDMIGKSKPKYEDIEIRCWADAPVEVRAARGLLLGLRWQLGEWGLNNKAIKVDVPSGTMTIEGKLVATAHIEDDLIKVSWNDKTWEEWTDLHESAEWKMLINTSNERLRHSAEKKTALVKVREWAKDQ